MLTVTKRPESIILSSNCFDAVLSADTMGHALITSSSHGLVDDDYIYIDSDIEDYNGLWQVDSITSSTFKIKRGADFQVYVKPLTITFCKAQTTHLWNAVHLPVVYELRSNISPVNPFDPIYFIFPYSAGEFLNFALPDASGIILYDYVWFKETVSDAGKAYQVIGVESIGGGNSKITINKSQSDLYSVQKYFNNYHAVVRINAGIPATNPQEYIKPYEVLATLKLIPDNNNTITFSIHEVLKAHIKTRNNLLLSSLPNNTDFWTSFYISYAESYDDSNGFSVTTYTSSYTDDSFIGYVANAKLPFKNKYSGAMSEYVSNVDKPAKWLTNFQELRIFSDLYRDISFINAYDETIYIFYDEILTQTLVDPGIGILRVPIDSSTPTCITARVEREILGEPSAITLPALSVWVNVGNGPFDPNWTTGSAPVISLNNQTSDFLIADYAFIVGREYVVTFGITIANTTPSTNPRTFAIRSMDNLFNVLTTQTTTLNSSDGTQTIVGTFTAVSGATKISVVAYMNNQGSVTVNSVSATESGASTYSYVPITEEICLVMDTMTSACPPDIIPTYTYRITEDEFLRITEDGDYRIIE